MNPPYPLPMLATLGQPPKRFSAYAIEAKYDGQRGIAVVDRGTVNLFSRNGADITGTFPEVTAALDARGGRLVLDGEIVAPNEDGVPCFSRLQRRWPQNRRPSTELLRQIPVQFFVFDVLRYGSKDITRQTYQARRERLNDIAGKGSGSAIQFPGSWTDTNPATVLAASAELGLEGIICKHLLGQQQRYAYVRNKRSLTSVVAIIILHPANTPETSGSIPVGGTGVSAGQQGGAVFEAHHGARRLGAGCCCWRCLPGRRLVAFVVVDPDASVVPVSL